MKVYERSVLKTSTFVCVLCICIYYLFKGQYMCNLLSCCNNVVHNLSVQKFLNSKASSLWCTEDIDKHKLCTIQNLCFLPKSENQFLFFISNETIISGVQVKDDLKILSLTSVMNYNGFRLKLAVINESNWEDVIMKNEEVFLISRFKPDNIMHVIHDDLLPLYVTYSKICEGDVYKCTSKYRLAFLDGANPGPYYDWYTLLSDKEPMFLDKEEKMVCFEKVRVGLSKESVWFQYGYRTVHGPIQPVIEKPVLKSFTDFIFNRFKISRNTEMFYPDLGILFSRKLNRKINNEDFVIQGIKNVYGTINPNKNLSIVNVDISSNDSKTIISLLRKSSVLVGMHGSAMILSVFLPPGAVIIELFPFGLQPQYVSPTKAMCSIQGINYQYFSWVNTKENNSITHEDFPPLLGGISYLPEEVQATVKTIKLVPPVRCCHNPVYLYRMYQDTIIDESFTVVLTDAFTAQRKCHKNTDHITSVEHYQFNKFFFPSPVTNITCLFMSGRIIISWNKPINVNLYIPEYRLHLLIGNQSIIYNTNATWIFVKINEQPAVKVQIWINCIVRNNEGIDAYAEC